MNVQDGGPRLNISRPILKLITVGRKTGIPHVVAARFAYADGVFYVLSGRPGSDWVLNAVASRTARIRIDELVCDAAVSSASPAERVVAIDGFRSKYGARFTDEWYSAASDCLRLTPTTTPSRRGGARGEADVTTTFEEWKSRNGDYYSGVAEAFDSASDEYDHTIRGNFINTWIRETSIGVLLDIAGPDDVMLEIGCGTGAEAVELSRHVSGIVATDISPRMVALLKRKIEARKLGKKIVALELGAREIGRSAAYLPGGSTRVAYSLNGALNCEPEIEFVPGELGRVVRKGGYFVCSIRNTLCISEALAHAAVLQFDKMAPRKRQPTMVSVGGMDIPSYYYRPSEFARAFRPAFRVKRMFALPAILPPAYLSDYYFRARRIIGFAERVERAIAGSFPFNRFGDQTLFVFQRVE